MSAGSTALFLLSMVVGGFLFWLVYRCFTMTKRRDLESAAKIELTELDSEEGPADAQMFDSSFELIPEKVVRARRLMRTSAGRTLLRLEAIEKWLVIAGPIVGLLVLLYFTGWEMD